MDIMLSFIAWAKYLKFRSRSFIADKINIGWLKNRIHGIEEYVWSFQPTFQCNFNCSYCVQKFGIKDLPLQVSRIGSIGLDEFIHLNKLDFLVDCLFIQGGEPLLAKGLDELISKFTKFRKILIISNFSLPVDNFIKLKDKVSFELKFIGSFHPEFSDMKEFFDRASELRKEKMLQYCCMVDRGWRQNIFYLREFLKKGIPLVLYSYVGPKNGRISPPKASYACDGSRRKASCKTEMVLISSNGKVFNCHTKMYMDRDEVCTIYNINDFPKGVFECRDFGICHPCQVDNVYVRSIDG